MIAQALGTLLAGAILIRVILWLFTPKYEVVVE